MKLYGRDAQDAALLSTVWRTIWLRQPGAPVGFGRLRQVEHGAASSGNSSPPWHDDGIAHGRLDADHFLVEDGRLGLVHFQGAAVAPASAQLRSDDAQLFITSIELVGRELALEGLVEHRTVEEIEELLPYLQPTALTADQRRMMKVLDIELDALRADMAEASGVEAPPLIRMRRFTLGSVVRVALPALAIVMPLSALAGFDLEEFLDSLQDAAWWLVLIGFVVAQLPRVAQAVSTLGAAPVPLPLGPVYALQLAISYVNLAIPTAAARVAVNVRFFQRQGVSPTTAVATGALDGVIGFIVQAVLLGSLLLFIGLSLDVDVGGPASAATRIAWMLAVVLAIAVDATTDAASPSVSARRARWRGARGCCAVRSGSSRRSAGG